MSYQFGSRSLFRPDIRTVHVPVFQSESLRPGLDSLLTEAVAKEIESRTHLKLADAAYADSVLSGQILNDRKRVVAEDSFDQPRDNEITYVVQVSWIDRQGRHMMQRARVPVPGLIVSISQQANFAPEPGQSYATAEMEAIQRLARQIVAEMEARW